MISIGRIENTNNTADIIDQLNSILSDFESQMQQIQVSYDDDIAFLNKSVSSISKSLSDS